MKLVSGIILTLLLASMFTLASDIQPVRPTADMTGCVDLASEIRERGSPGIIPSPEVIKHYRDLGEDPPRVSDWPARLAESPVIGAKRVLVILIDFPDQAGVQTQTYYQTLLFGGTQGTMSHYYREVSYGQLTITGVMAGAGWYRSTRNMVWWGADTSGDIDNANADISELAREAVRLADANVNFKTYDANNNNVIDPDELSICIVHAGNEQASSGVTTDIWSHRWHIYGQGYTSPRGTSLADTFVDGCRISKHPTDDVGGYLMQAETSPMGTFAHEFGHELGLPDLYNTDTGDPVVGDWSLMDVGMWLDDGSTPAHLDPWCKVQLGWVAPVVVEKYVNTSIDQTESINGTRLYRLNIEGTQEYFLIENREKTGYDSYLPEAGVLIWHIDEAMSNNTGLPLMVALEQPGGSLRFAAYSSNDWQTTFDYGTTPNSNANDGTSTSVSVWGISAEGPLMQVIFFNGYAYTDKSQYAVGEGVTVGFLNTGPTPITLPSTAPWIIFNASGRAVYSIIALQVLIDVAPGEKTEWRWNQVNNLGQQVSSGTYIFLMRTLAGNFLARFGIITGPAGKRQLTTHLAWQDLPSLVVVDTGVFQGYFLAYQSGETGIANNGDIFIDKFDKNWTLLRRVQATSLPSYQDSPSLALVFDGSNYYLKLAYVSDETGNYDIFVQDYDLSLNLLAKRQVTTSAYDQDFPSMVFDRNQSVYIAYQSWETGDSYWGDIFIERFDLNLVPVKKVRVTSETSYQDYPSLLYNSETGLLYVAYVSNEIGNLDIFLKQYDSNLDYSGQKFQLTTDPTTQFRPSLAPIFASTSPRIRGFQLAYSSSETGTSNSYDIFVKKFDLDCNELNKTQITNDQFLSVNPSIAPSLTALGSSWCRGCVAYVSNETGNWDIMLQPTPALLQPPGANFSYSPERPRVNESMVFNASASYDQDGTITSFAWDFGDGNKTSVEQPVINHTYKVSGNYTVILNVTDNQGLWNTTMSTVTVENITLPGDVNSDGIVDIYDALVMGGAYNSRPGSPNWNPIADLNKDNVVDIYDALILAGNYGKKA